MFEHVNLILSDQISAYRKGYSSQHVLLKLIEEWRTHLDNKQVVGAVPWLFTLSLDSHEQS